MEKTIFIILFLDESLFKSSVAFELSIKISLIELLKYILKFILNISYPSFTIISGILSFSFFICLRIVLIKTPIFNCSSKPL